MLRRSVDNKMIGGVCGGLGDWAGIDPVLVRLAFVIAFLMFGVGPLVYLVMWIVVPKAEPKPAALAAEEPVEASET